MTPDLSMLFVYSIAAFYICMYENVCLPVTAKFCALESVYFFKWTHRALIVFVLTWVAELLELSFARLLLL